MTEPFYPLHEAEQMIASFIDGSLSPSQFDHGHHLVFGLYAIAKYGAGSYPFVKKSILNFNRVHHKMGYHETMTRFWIAAIEHHRGTVQQLVWTQEALDNLIFDEHLTRRNLWTDYYSERLMQSEEARRRFVEPDRRAFW